MKKLILAAALLPVALTTSDAFAAATTAPAFAGEGRWFADYDEAVEVAKAEGKDLLVDFTGSDWCGWCIKLHDEVFSEEEWIEAASKDYVFVALDFPRGDEAKALVPNPERNEELKNSLGVRGFPTIFLMNVEGEAYAQTGYQAGGPTAYLEHMGEIAAEGKRYMAAVPAAVEAFQAAEGAAKWTAWDALVAVYRDIDGASPFSAKLVEHVRWGFDTDADNAAGKREVAAKALLSKGIADAVILDFAETNDPENKKGMLERVAEAKFGQVRDDASALAAVAALERVNGFGFQDQELGFMLNFTAARWCDGPLDDAEKKAVFVKKAMEIGTDEEGAMAALKKMAG